MVINEMRWNEVVSCQLSAFVAAVSCQQLSPPYGGLTAVDSLTPDLPLAPQDRGTTRQGHPVSGLANI